MKGLSSIWLLAGILFVSYPSVALAEDGESSVQDAGYACGGPLYSGPARLELSQTQRTTLENILVVWLDKARPLRSELYAKRLELEYLGMNAQTEPKQISALVQDIKSLREQLLALRFSTTASIQKELALDRRQAGYLLNQAGLDGADSFRGYAHRGRDERRGCGNVYR